jgi:arylsulfatase A-like enzyme
MPHKLTLATGLLLGIAAPAVLAERPNVILVMADDLGWGDTGFNGHAVIKTPHLDAMSRSGIRFRRFYSAGSVCSPTRGSCLTGRHPYRYGVYTANRGHLRAHELSLAEILKEHGYSTGHFGKWHLGTLTPEFSGKGPGRKPKENYATPGMNGFDEWFSTEFAVSTWDPYDPARSHRKGKSFDVRALFWHNGKPVETPLEGCTSAMVMDKAMAFIDRAARARKPFFSVIWFHAPHAPVAGGPEYRALYPNQTENEQHYYAVVTALDEQVGRLRARLRELGVENDTMLWFCSDNGPEGNPGRRARSQGSAGPFRGRKRSLYEGGVRVPALLEWPAKISAAREVDTPCVTSDYLPTVLDVLGVSLPRSRPYDGVSLLPLIEGATDRRPFPIAFQFRNQASLNGERFKLVHNSGKGRPRSDNGSVPTATYELYDLISDPGETKNVAAAHPAVVMGMKEVLAAWRESCRKSDEGALDF